MTCLFYYTSGRTWLGPAGLGIFVFACFTDAADGFLARKLDQVTAFGTYIDPIADKLLLMTGFFSLSFMNHLPDSMRIPAWVTIPVATRELIILIGSSIIFVTTGRLRAEPLFIGKATTVFQMMAIFTSFVALPSIAEMPIFAATVALTLASGALYVRMGGRMLQV